MFAALIPLVLSLAPQLAPMIFGANGADATARIAAVVQSVVGSAADLNAPGGADAAVAHIQANPQMATDLAAKLADLHTQMRKEQDDAAQVAHQGALDELQTRLADVGAARTMVTELSRTHGGLAYGGVVVSIVIVAGFIATTYAALTNHLGAAEGQSGSVLVGTLAAMATQVANYWLGSSQGSSAKNVMLANAQNSLAASVPSHLLKSTDKE
ncbi:MAG TPA: hypothetical protein VGC09_23400 [Rhodopila sp.]